MKIQKEICDKFKSGLDHDPANDAPNTGGVTNDDGNWGGPLLRHMGRSNVLFSDGHADTKPSSQWFWGGSPWLKPDIGGEGQ